MYALSGLVAGDSAICGRLAVLILCIGSWDHHKHNKGRVGFASLKSQRVEARRDLILRPFVRKMQSSSLFVGLIF